MHTQIRTGMHSYLHVKDFANERFLCDKVTLPQTRLMVAAKHLGNRGAGQHKAMVLNALQCYLGVCKLN